MSSLWNFSKNFQGCITVYLSRYEQSSYLCECNRWKLAFIRLYSCKELFCDSSQWAASLRTVLCFFVAIRFTRNSLILSRANTIVNIFFIFSLFFDRNHLLILVFRTAKFIISLWLFICKSFFVIFQVFCFFRQFINTIQLSLSAFVHFYFYKRVNYLSIEKKKRTVHE